MIDESATIINFITLRVLGTNLVARKMQYQED